MYSIAAGLALMIAQGTIKMSEASKLKDTEAKALRSDESRDHEDESHDHEDDSHDHVEDHVTIDTCDSVIGVMADGANSDETEVHL